MISKRERQFKHVLKSELESGKSEKVATRIAAAVTNKTRARLAKEGRGPKLIRDGGSRNQYYPGKEKAKLRKLERQAASLWKRVQGYRKAFGPKKVYGMREYDKLFGSSVEPDCLASKIADLRRKQGLAGKDASDFEALGDYSWWKG